MKDTINKQDREAVPYYPEADTFDFQASLEGIKHAVWTHKLLVFLTCLMTLGIVIFYIAVWPPVYSAEVVIAAASDEDMQRNAFYQQWSIFRKDNVSDEAQFMTSGPILRQVIKRLDLTYDEVYHPFFSYAVHLWGESTIGKTYRKIKYSIFPKEKGLYSPTEEEIAFAKTLKNFKKGVNITAVGETNVGILLVKSSTHRVAEIANTIIDVYLENRINRFFKEAEMAHQSLSAETQKVHDELVALEDKMKLFYSKHGLLLLFEKDRAELTQWLELESSIINIESNLAKLEDSLQAIDLQLKTEEKEIINSRTFQINVLHDRLTEMELALTHAKQHFRPDSPEVEHIENKIDAAKQLMNQQGEKLQTQTTLVRSESYAFLHINRVQLETELAGAKAELEEKKQAASRMKTLLDSIPGKMQLYHEMERAHEILEAKYSALSEKLMSAAVSKATLKSVPSSMRVVEYASAPERASWPKKKLLIAVAIVVGLMCGIMAALLLELIFVRVTRHRLWKAESEQGLYAIVKQDRAYLERTFPLPSPK